MRNYFDKILHSDTYVIQLKKSEMFCFFLLVVVVGKQNKMATKIGLHMKRNVDKNSSCLIVRTISGHINDSFGIFKQLMCNLFAWYNHMVLKNQESRWVVTKFFIWKKISLETWLINYCPCISPCWKCWVSNSDLIPVYSVKTFP